jgi:hypothetical protein
MQAPVAWRYEVPSRQVTALIMEYGLQKIEDVMHHVMIELPPVPTRRPLTDDTSQPVWISENSILRHQKGPPIAGFLDMGSLQRDRIRTITLRNWPTFSSHPLKNSRFLETRLPAMFRSEILLR